MFPSIDAESLFWNPGGFDPDPSAAMTTIIFIGSVKMVLEAWVVEVDQNGRQYCNGPGDLFNVIRGKDNQNLKTMTFDGREYFLIAHADRE